MKILITGGAGFVGHHFVEHFLKETDAKIVVLDKLTYASNGLDRLRDINVFGDSSERVKILQADLNVPISDGIYKEIGDIDYIFHLAAESHVDNSIIDPEPFVKSNVLGTMHLLNFARRKNEKISGNFKGFFYFSTDEVFGPAPGDYSYKETDQHNPSNPYAAAKSGGEMLVKAYGVTYGLPYVITRSMNIIGERQHPEKFIMLCINKILKGEKITIHANPDLTAAGTRFYIHARNVAAGYNHLLSFLERGVTEGILNEEFHITGQKEVSNDHLAQLIHAIMVEKTGKQYEFNYELVNFHGSRPGHDLRYALDGSKMKDRGWEPSKTFEESLAKTVEWVIDPINSKWLKY